MRIIYIHSEPFPSEKAGGKVTLDTAAGLARQGVEVDLIVARRLGVAAAASNFEHLPAGLSIYAVPTLAFAEGLFRPSWNGLFYGLAVRLINRLVRQSPPPSALICRNLKFTALLRFFNQHWSVPLIWETHKTFYADTKETGDTGLKRLKRLRRLRLEKRLYQSIDGLIVLSASFEQLIRQQFAFPKPICVAPSGVEVSDGEIITDANGSVQDGLIVYVGQLHPHKGVEVLLEALSLLPDNCRLLVIGGDEGLEVQKTVAHSRGVANRVEFTGYVPSEKVNSYLSKAQIAVAPLRDCLYNRYFTSPLKLLEYMAAGVPVVASRLPAVAEIIEDGQTGLLVEPDNAVALAAGIGRLLKDKALRRRLGQQACQEVKKYSWTERARRIKDFVDGLNKCV